MRPAGCVLLLFLLIGVHCAARDLPDACGDERVHFTVTTEPGQPLAGPAAGRAQVVFIESVYRDFCLGCNPIITRSGMDGVWLGANKDNSYFAVDIAPGEHEVCANWQRVFNGKVHITTLKAEAGKTYYMLVRVTDRKYKVGTVEREDEKVRLYLLSDSEGRRLIENSAHSVASVYE